MIAIDPFYFGECRIETRDYLYALLVSALGERPLGMQAGPGGGGGALAAAEVRPGDGGSIRPAHQPDRAGGRRASKPAPSAK